MKWLRDTLSFAKTYLHVLVRAIPVLWRADPLQTTLLVMALIFQGVLPAASLWITKQVVDRIAAALEAGIVLPLSSLAFLVGIWIVAILVDAVIAPWSSVLQGNLNEKLTAHINLQLMEKTKQLPGLHYYEDAQFYDELQVIQRGASYQPLNLLIFLANSGRELLIVISMLGLLFSAAWWVPLIILLTALPQTYVSGRLQQKIWETNLARSREARQMQYFSEILLSDRYAKETRLFSTFDFFINQYRQAFQTVFADMIQARLKQATWSTILVLISAGGNALVFIYVINQALLGRVTLGDVLVFIQSLAFIQQNLSMLAQDTPMLYDTLLYMQKFSAFLKNEPVLKQSAEPHQPADRHNAIRFDRVNFAYPDGRRALHDISFVIQPGEKIAIVGENGAGKSTLVKLISRFYDPTDGTIYVNDVPLHRLALDTWRERLAPVFQDFNHYELTVKQNIQLGNLNAPDDFIQPAAEQAGIHRDISRLPEQYETQLGKQFDGTDLSTGQWQKLALAKIFLRHHTADLLILDEPSASLDPRSEYELFRQFTKLAHDKTTLFITHRLASVQMADRILVLKEGRLIESGTHEALLEQNGEYATLWKMQAEKYQMPVT